MDSGQLYELLYVDVRLLVSQYKSQYYGTAYPSNCNILALHQCYRILALQ